MAVSVICECGKRLKAPDEYAGKQAKCPACQRTLMIPVPLEGSTSTQPHRPDRRIIPAAQTGSRHASLPPKTEETANRTVIVVGVVAAFVTLVAVVSAFFFWGRPAKHTDPRIANADEARQSPGLADTPSPDNTDSQGKSVKPFGMDRKHEPDAEPIPEPDAEPIPEPDAEPIPEPPITRTERAYVDTEGGSTETSITTAIKKKLVGTWKSVLVVTSHGMSPARQSTVWGFDASGKVTERGFSGPGLITVYDRGHVMVAGKSLDGKNYVYSARHRTGEVIHHVEEKSNKLFLVIGPPEGPEEHRYTVQKLEGDAMELVSWPSAYEKTTVHYSRISKDPRSRH